MALKGFKFHPEVLDALARHKAVGDALRERAEKVEAEAKRLAPVRSGPGGGSYRNGIRAEVDMTAKGYEARVNGTHFTSHWIEFGTARLPARQPLRRALEAVMGNIKLVGRGGGE